MIFLYAKPPEPIDGEIGLIMQLLQMCGYEYCHRLRERLQEQLGLFPLSKPSKPRLRLVECQAGESAGSGDGGRP